MVIQQEFEKKYQELLDFDKGKRSDVYAGELTLCFLEEDATIMPYVNKTRETLESFAKKIRNLRKIYIEHSETKDTILMAFNNLEEAYSKYQKRKSIKPEPDYFYSLGRR